MSESLSQTPRVHLEYELIDGAVPAWLVAGPMTKELPDWMQRKAPDIREQLIRESDATERDVPATPAEWAAFDTQQGGERWRVTSVDANNLLDLAVTTDACQRVEAWAYSQIITQAELPVVFTLTTHSPTDVWINGELVASSHRFYDGRPGHLVFNAKLATGPNELLVRLQTVALGPTPLALGVVLRADAPLSLRLPTLVTPVARRQQLGAIMERAYLTRDVYVRQQKIDLWWPKSMTEVDQLTARLQTPQNRIVAEATPLVERGGRVAFGQASDFRPGEYEIRLLPELNEYYTENMRVDRRLPLAIAHAAHSDRLYGDLDGRRKELFRTVAAGPDLWAALAKLALGESDRVQDSALDGALADVNEGRAKRRESLMALVRLIARHPDVLSTPQRQAVQAALREAYGTAPSLLPAHPYPAAAILDAAAALLIAERLPNFRMDVAGRMGVLRSLLHRYAVGDWSHVNDGAAMAQLFVALAHLVDLAGNPELIDLATVCLDKLCFELALNSYQGIPGGGQSAGATRWIQSGRLHPLSGVCRLLWGAGAFNTSYDAAMSVAMATTYTMPDLVIAAALDRTTDAWSQLRYGGEAGAASNLCQTIYRTPDYLLGALVDYRVGEPGDNETVLQAVLGPEAIITLNHPGVPSHHDAYAPNYWRGNGRLPRVGQWHDVVCALYVLPDDTPQPFTHAYFPLASFDEVAEAGPWLCARKGDGYIALTAAQGLARSEVGPTAMREVRSPGTRNGWIVQMGRAEIDGPFNQFVAAVGDLRPVYDLDGSDPALQVTTLRGETLVMRWRHDLTVDDQSVDSTEDVHVASPYGQAPLPATHLDLTFQSYVLRLAFDATQPDTV